MDLISWGIQVLKDFIEAVGYPGIFLLMTLESMFIPVPSEIVMTFGGWLAYDGVLSLFWVGLAGTLGCAVGSMIGYWIGQYGGRAFIKKYGRYLLLKESSIDAAEVWFKKYGAIAVFGTRLLPVVRTFISIPAGIAKMPFLSFVVLSFLGSLPWCFALAYAGYLLGANYDSISGYFGVLTVAVIIVAAVLLIYFIYVRKRPTEQGSEGQGS